MPNPILRTSEAIRDQGFARETASINARMANALGKNMARFQADLDQEGRKEAGRMNLAVNMFANSKNPANQIKWGKQLAQMFNMDEKALIGDAEQIQETIKQASKLPDGEEKDNFLAENLFTQYQSNEFVQGYEKSYIAKQQLPRLAMDWTQKLVDGDEKDYANVLAKASSMLLTRPDAQNILTPLIMGSYQKLGLGKGFDVNKIADIALKVQESMVDLIGATKEEEKAYFNSAMHNILSVMRSATQGAQRKQIDTMLQQYAPPAPTEDSEKTGGGFLKWLFGDGEDQTEQPAQEEGVGFAQRAGQNFVETGQRLGILGETGREPQVGGLFEPDETIETEIVQDTPPPQDNDITRRAGETIEQWAERTGQTGF